MALPDQPIRNDAVNHPHPNTDFFLVRLIGIHRNLKMPMKLIHNPTYTVAIPCIQGTRLNPVLSTSVPRFSSAHKAVKKPQSAQNTESIWQHTLKCARSGLKELGRITPLNSLAWVTTLGGILVPPLFMLGLWPCCSTPLPPATPKASGFPGNRHDEPNERTNKLTLGPSSAPGSAPKPAPDPESRDGVSPRDRQSSCP